MICDTHLAYVDEGVDGKANIIYLYNSREEDVARLAGIMKHYIIVQMEDSDE